MKILFLVYCTTDEAEGMFNEDGDMLDFWFHNDAMWRKEYYQNLMNALGFEVIVSEDKKLVKKLNKAVKDC